MNDNEKSESSAEIYQTTRDRDAELREILTELGVDPEKITPDRIAILIEAFRNR